MQLREPTMTYAFTPSAIPKPLQRLPMWINWQAVPKTGKPGKFDKVPVNPTTGRRVSHNAERNRQTFEEAVEHYLSQYEEPGRPMLSGVGISLPPGLVAIDLDGVFRDDGTISPEHQEILNTFSDCYTEVSPSGNGLHIFLRGHANTFNSLAHGVEVYSIQADGESGGQFLTITGMVYQGRTQLRRDDRSADLKVLCDLYGAQAAAARQDIGDPPPAEGVPRTLEELAHDGIISWTWEALVSRMEPGPGNDHSLIDRYPALEGSPNPVKRSQALFAAALLFANKGIPLWEAFAILTDRDYALVRGIDDGRGGDAWCWRHVFGKLVPVYEAKASASAPVSQFDDLGEDDSAPPRKVKVSAATSQPDFAQERSVKSPGSPEAPPAQPAAKVKSPIELFRNATVMMDELVADDSIIEPPAIIDTWFRESTITMVYAPPGVGKSWFVLDLMRALHQANTDPDTTFGPWTVTKPEGMVQMPRCGYLDGEMALWQIKSRAKAIWPDGVPPGLPILSQALHELSEDAQPMNFADPKVQRWVNQWIEENDVQVVIIDNQMSWILVEDSNSADQMATFTNWIKSLRSKGLTPIVIHHAGKGGSQFGSMRNTLQIENVIKLEEAPEGTGGGSAFTYQFEKHRQGPVSPRSGVLEMQGGKHGLRMEYLGDIPDKNAAKTAVDEGNAVNLELAALREWRVSPEMSYRELAATLTAAGLAGCKSDKTVRASILPALLKRGFVQVSGEGKRGSPRTVTVTPIGIAWAEAQADDFGG